MDSPPYRNLLKACPFKLFSKHNVLSIPINDKSSKTLQNLAHDDSQALTSFTLINNFFNKFKAIKVFILKLWKSVNFVVKFQNNAFSNP